MKPLTLAIDVDETVADLLGAWLRRYNADTGDNLLPEDMRGWDMAKNVKPEYGDRIYRLVCADMYDRDEVMPILGARTAIHGLAAEGHRILYVTSCINDTADAKFRWLKRWGFLGTAENFVATKDKSLVRADVLFDDHVLNVEAFPGMAFLVNQPHNAGVECHRPRIASMVTASRALVAWRKFSPYRDAA